MSLDQLESKLMELPLDERREFARWFYTNESQILDSNEEDLSPELKAELDRRWEEIKTNPSIAVPVTDEWFQQLKKRFADVRTAQTSSL